MKPDRLKLKPLTQETFAAFGDVIQTRGHRPEEINYGQTRSYSGLAQVDAGDREGTAMVHIYRSRPISLPFRVEVMEYHPLGSQAFIPLHHLPFIVLVAPPSHTLHSKSIQAYITDGKQGINLYKRVWHHYQLSLDEICDYLVIDRGGPGENTVEQRLEKPLIIEEIL